MTRAEVRERFRAVVARGIARADREDRERLTRIRELPDLPDEDGGAAKRRASARRGNRARRRP